MDSEIHEKTGVDERTTASVLKWLWCDLPAADMRRLVFKRGADVSRAIRLMLLLSSLVASVSDAVALPEWPWPSVQFPFCGMLDTKAERIETLGLYDVDSTNPGTIIPRRWCDTIYRLRTMEPACREVLCVKRGFCDLCVSVHLWSGVARVQGASSGCLQYKCVGSTRVRNP
jgi:hypothetical protein